jgi:hypothetical protein
MTCYRTATTANGQHVTEKEASKLLADVSKRRVGLDEVRAPNGDLFKVSTVFLVFDHGMMSWDPQHQPVLFETGVFTPAGDIDIVERYCTEEQAREGHTAYVLLIEGGMYPPEEEGEQSDEGSETSQSPSG